MNLEVRLRHRFEGFSLDVEFSAPAGVTALFGRSGSGKTTIVNAVAGLLRPLEGLVVIDGETLLDTRRGIFLAPHRRRIGYVFQEGRLFPHLTVRQNLAYGGWFAPTRPATAEFDRVVGLLGIDGLLDRRPATLSGGEKQRVAIGRAILSAPRMLLMDEPLASLDDTRKAGILPYLEKLRDEAGVPILYVSHSMPEVARLATTVVALRDGRTVRSGPAAEVLSDPHAVPLLGVREAGAIVSARVAGHDLEDGLTEVLVNGARLFVPLIDAAPGTELRMRIHANDVILSLAPPHGLSALNVLACTVAEIHEGEGPGAAVALTCGAERLLARVTRRSIRELGLAPGVACHAIVKSMAVAQADLGA